MSITCKSAKLIPDNLFSSLQRCPLRTDHGQDSLVSAEPLPPSAERATDFIFMARRGPFGAIQDKKHAKKLGEVKKQHNQDDGLAQEGIDEKKGGKGKGGKKGTGLGKGERYLIHDFSGVVKAGEMMLVVVRRYFVDSFVPALISLLAGPAWKRMHHLPQIGHWSRRRFRRR